MVNNCRIISKLVNNQLQSYLDENSTLPPFIRKLRSTLTVLNDVYEALDTKNYSAALFIDLTEIFDTADHGILCQTLLDTYACSLHLLDLLSMARHSDL